MQDLPNNPLSALFKASKGSGLFLFSMDANKGDTMQDDTFDGFTPASLPARKALTVAEVKAKIRMMADGGVRWAMFRPGELTEGARAGLIVAGFTCLPADVLGETYIEVKW